MAGSASSPPRAAPMTCVHLHVLVAATVAWFLCTFLVVYLYASLAEDVEPLLPYISDTGTWVPESCIFGQLLGVGSFLLFFLVYFRYRYIKTAQPDKYTLTNAICLYLGWAAALGISLVGNFQENNVFAVHMIGANMSFGLGMIYQLLMWKISHGLSGYGSPTSSCGSYLRLLLALVSAVAYFTTFIFGYLGASQFNGEDYTKWSKEYAGYTYHVLSTSSEWICAFSTMFFLLTFYNEFKCMKIWEPEVEIMKSD